MIDACVAVELFFTIVGVADTSSFVVVSKKVGSNVVADAIPPIDLIGLIKQPATDGLSATPDALNRLNLLFVMLNQHHYQ